MVWRALFSLTLATMLWAWVTNTEDPDIARRISGVSVQAVNLNPNLVVLSPEQLPTLTVEVRGPQSRVQQLAAGDLHAEIDLSSLKAPGAKDVPIAIRTPAFVRVVNSSPSTVSVTLDQVVSKTFPLEVDKQASPASYNISKVDLSVQQVSVKGPGSALARVARVVVPVALGDHRDSFEAQFTPEARDAANARVPNVTIDPNTVKATVTVNRIGRTVSVVPDLVGTPPEGYRVSGTTVSPSFVVVDGSPDVLNQLILIATTPIDVSTQTKPFSVFDVQLVLPPGIRLVDPVTINVQVQIERQQVLQQFPSLVVQAINIGPGLRATISPSDITVTISGPLDRLRQLSSKDIQVVIDLQGKGPGTYTLTPNITVPPDLRLADLPPTVQVRIERVASPVPTPGHSPTVTPTPPAPRPTP